MKIYTRVVMDWDGNVIEEDSFDYDGPLALAGGGGGGDSTQTVEQNADPWEPVQPYLEQGFQYAPWLFENPPMYYPGSTTAGLTPETLYAQQMIANQALSGAPSLQAAQSGLTNFINSGWDTQGISALQPFASGQYYGKNFGLPYLKPFASGDYVGSNEAYSYLRPTASGDFLGANPYLADYVRIAQESAANPINAQFASTGRFGSGLHQSELAGRYGDIATSIYAPAYESERNRMLQAANTIGGLGQAERGMQLQASGQIADIANLQRQMQLQAATSMGSLEDSAKRTYLAALGLAPAIEQSMYLPAQMLGQVGAQRDAYAQQLLNDDIARWNYMQNLPQQQYGQYMQNLNFAAPYGSSTGTTTTDSGSGGFSPTGAIGGALGMGAASAAGAFGAVPAGAMLGPAGIPLIIGGALLGGLL